MLVIQVLGSNFVIENLFHHRVKSVLGSVIVMTENINYYLGNKHFHNVMDTSIRIRSCIP